MAITGDGLTFLPLYWTFHDQWRYYTHVETALSGGGVSVDHREYPHFGHAHLFMMGFDWGGDSQQAFSGSQSYNFEVVDIWGPRSGDPNQQLQYTVVGTPKWYFHVREVWRRIYIQPWDLKVSTTNPSLMRGVKFDACAADKLKGPYREGRDGKTAYAPAFLQDARTLPIDYFETDSLSQEERTNWLKTQADAVMTQEWPSTYPPYDPSTYSPLAFDLQHGSLLYAGGNMGLDIHPAARAAFGDRMYIWPLIEYQTVTQLNWQRFPGWQAANDTSDTNFGDGWSVNVEVPFTDPATGVYRSPFGAAGTRSVSPVGVYHNDLVADANKPRYRTVEYNDAENPSETPYYYDTPEKMPPELSGQPITWHNPFGDDADGRWVQQCLGGIVQARAEIVLEHKFGGRSTVVVSATQYVPTTPFAGTDQGRV